MGRAVDLAHLNPKAATAAGRIMKRALDLAIAAPAALVTLPLMLVIALAIRLDSPGPAILKQKRVGLRGATFECRKFRSMYVNNAPGVHQEVVARWFHGIPDAHGGFKIRQDPRVTRVGRWIRRTSLDELPQLFNVLRGEMSLVGPRPAIEYELAYYEAWYFDRFLVRPGITGLWQVSGRDQLSAPEMMRLDLQYIRNWSVGLDLKMILLTVPAVLGRKLKGTHSG